MQQELDLSEQARQLIENPLLQQFFADTEQRMVTVWKNSKPEDIDGREQVFRYLAVLQDFRAYLTRYLADPAFAEAELERMMSQ